MKEPGFFGWLISRLTFFGIVKRWFHKRLVDLKWYSILYYVINNNIFNKDRAEIIGYAEDQGDVQVYLTLTIKPNIEGEILWAFTRGKSLFFQNALYLLSYSRIISIYLNLNNHVSSPHSVCPEYQQHTKSTIIKYLLKEYKINLYFNQLTYELNDVKPIIYNYYLELLVND